MIWIKINGSWTRAYFDNRAVWLQKQHESPFSTITSIGNAILGGRLIKNYRLFRKLIKIKTLTSNNLWPVPWLEMNPQRLLSILILISLIDKKFVTCFTCTSYLSELLKETQFRVGRHRVQALNQRTKGLQIRLHRLRGGFSRNLIQDPELWSCSYFFPF